MWRVAASPRLSGTSSCAQALSAGLRLLLLLPVWLGRLRPPVSYEGAARCAVYVRASMQFN